MRTKHHDRLSAFLRLWAMIACSYSAMKVHIGSHQLHRSGVSQHLQQQQQQIPVIDYSEETHQRLYPILQPTIKLPVWPVYNGVIAQVLDWLKLSDLSNRLINALGGRVQPISLASLDLSPFLLLVHHSHSFTPYDPFRAMTRWFLPEGFPAHPHSGFDTVTYCIRGGLRHRDSEGLSMRYGDGDVQWMRAGRGVIHEEMWDVQPGRYDRIEIFQLWVNLPGEKKFVIPSVAMLRRGDIPVVSTVDGCCSVKVICGEVTVDESEAFSRPLPDEGSLPQTRREGAVCGPGGAIAGSNIALLHLEMVPHSRVDIAVGGGRGGAVTAAAYVRRGCLSSSSSSSSSPVDDHDKGRGLASSSRMAFDQGSFVIFRPSEKEELSSLCGRVMTVTAGADGLDALLLLGEPLGEQVIWQGPFVQRSERDLLRSARAFEGIGREGFWDHQLSDPEWERHVEELRLQETLTRLD